MKFTKAISIGLVSIALAFVLPAQFASVQTAEPISIAQTDAPVEASAPDTAVQLAANAEGLPPMALADLPRGGTFWIVQSNGGIPPYPCLPDEYTNCPIYSLADSGIYLVDGSFGQVPTASPRLNRLSASRGAFSTANTASVADAVAALGNSVLDLIAEVEESQIEQSIARMFGPEDDTPATDGATPSAALFDPNGLWMQITNTSNVTTGGILHNGTNQVYAIESTTNLALPCASWRVEAELWPVNDGTNCQPFIVQNHGNQQLYLRVQDWTGVYLNGLPCWWTWKYFGDLSEMATDLDANGNMLGYDFTNDIIPTVFTFTGLEVADNYVSTSQPTVQLDVAGKPCYVATLVDDENFSNAIWNTYSGSTVTVNLGNTEGWHSVWIGLRGHGDATNAAVWQWKRLKLDTTPPALVLTAPTNGTIDVPVIQLTGYSPEALGSISYDLSNAAGTVTNQPVFITTQAYSTATFEFTTNFFQGFDVGITNGVNQFTIHATDLAGNVTATSFSVALNYSNKPPVAVQSLWPQDGMKVCGSSFVWHGMVSDPTALVTVQTVDVSGITNVFHGAVGRDGKFWVQNLPLNSGTNHFTLTATDVAGNITTANLAVIQGDAGLTIDPIPPNQTTVTGKINSTNFTIWVNGVQATITGNTWEANHVPIPPNNSLVRVTAIPNNGGGQ